MLDSDAQEQEALILDAVDRFLAREVAPHAQRLEAADEYPEGMAPLKKNPRLFKAPSSLFFSMCT